LPVKRGIDFSRYTVRPEALLLPGVKIKWAAAINKYIIVREIIIIDKGNTFSRADEDIIQNSVSLTG